MNTLLKYLYLFGSYIAVFLLGAYADAAIKHNEYIETYRWIITAFFGIFFFVQYKEKNNVNN